MDSSDLAANAPIGGRYQPIRCVGEGGMSRVLEAVDLDTGEHVALKIPADRLLHDASARERFLREAQASVMLDHPNVVRVVDVITRDDGAPVMVLELLEGETLASRLRRHGSLSLAHAAAFLVPVLEALTHAHARGLVHRDFKPDNIFLARAHGRVVPKLLDFGITKAIRGSLLARVDVAVTEEILGTPHYMAPEQVCADGEIDARVDVWAAGVVLYECLAGVRPFPGTNVGQVLRAILLQPPIPLVHHVEDIPVELTIAVSEALSSAREQRPRDVSGLLDVLRVQLDGTEPTVGVAGQRSGDARRSGEPLAAVAGQRRPVTILVGLVADARSVGPQRAFRLSVALRELARELGARFNAVVVEQLDLGAALVFGLPKASSNDSERALRAARALHHEFGEALQIGVASGLVAVPEGTGPRGDAWLEARPWQAARELAERATPGTTATSDIVARTTKRPDGALFGRRRELWQLEGALGGCLESELGAVVVLRGEAGIGKSRLARELVERAGARGFRTHAAHIFDFGGHPELDVARGLLGELLLDHRGALDETDLLVLDELLRLPVSAQVEAERRTLTPEVRDRFRIAAIRRLLRYASRLQPLLLWIDDVHWADAASLELVTHVLDVVGDARVVVVLTTRPVESPSDPSWTAALRAASPLTVDLGPLRAEDALALALDHGEEQEAVVRACVDRAGGNPLFLLSMVEELDAAPRTVPVSIHSIVSAKLDRLGEGAREAVQAAAVLGRRFGIDPLEHVVPGARLLLPQLVSADLLHPDVDAYLFRHDLVRDAVYRSLLPRPRAAFHRRAADWFRLRDPPLYARHLDGAGDPAAGAAHLDAARHELSNQRLQSALGLARRGEQLAEDDALNFELGMLCGELERRLGHVGDSIESFRSLAARAHTDTQRTRAYLGQVAALNMSDRQQEGLAVLERANLAAADDDALLAAIHSMRGTLLFSSGDDQACLREQELALAAARRAGDAAAEVQALSGLADAHYKRGDYASTIEVIGQCIELARREQMPRLEAMSLSMFGVNHIHGLDMSAARELCARSVELARATKDAKARVLTLIGNAEVLLQLLDLDGCERDGQLGLEIARRLGAVRFAQYALVRLGCAAYLRGRLDDARRHFDEAWTLAEAASTSFLGAAILAGMALVDRARAPALLDEGEALLQDPRCISHSQLHFYAYGIEAAYLMRDATRLRRLAAGMQGHGCGERVGFCALHGERGLVLAEVVEQGLGESARARLSALRERAHAGGLLWAARLIDDVLAGRV